MFIFILFSFAVPSEGRWRDACAFTVDLVDFFIFFFFFSFLKGSRVCCWLHTSTVDARKGKKNAHAFLWSRTSQSTDLNCCPQSVSPTFLPGEGPCGRMSDGLESPAVYGLISRWEKTVLIRIRARHHHNFSLGFMWSNLSKLWNKFTALHFVLKHTDWIARF